MASGILRPGRARETPKAGAEQGGVDITASEQASVRSSCHGPAKTRDRGLAGRPEPSQHSRTNEAAPGPTTSSLTRCAPKSSLSWSPGAGTPGAALAEHGGDMESLPELSEAGSPQQLESRGGGKSSLNSRPEGSTRPCGWRRVWVLPMMGRESWLQRAGSLILLQEPATDFSSREREVGRPALRLLTSHTPFRRALNFPLYSQEIKV